MDGQLGLIGGQPEGDPGGRSHRERLVESGSNGIEKGRVRCGWSLHVGDYYRHGTVGVNFHCEPEGKVTVVGPEERCDDVGDCSGDVFFLGVRGGGGSRGEEMTFDFWEGLSFQVPEGGLGQGPDLVGTAGGGTFLSFLSWSLKSSCCGSVGAKDEVVGCGRTRDHGVTVARDEGR